MYELQLPVQMDCTHLFAILMAAILVANVVGLAHFGLSSLRGAQFCLR